MSFLHVLINIEIWSIHLNNDEIAVKIVLDMPIYFSILLMDLKYSVVTGSVKNEN